jgi:hypothetical protein
VTATGEGSEAAIVLIVYNRPSHTAQAVAQVAAARPSQLFVVADGPKRDVPGDSEKCAAVLDAIRRIDWPGDVHWNIAPANLGCRKRIQSGLAWAFEQVDAAIIVEDDCVVEPSFFAFASELLDYYRNDHRIGVISAQGYRPPSGGTSYHVSKFPLIWGWATWRRTWQIYEPDLDSWPSVRDTDWLNRHLGDPLLAAYWRACFDQVRGGYDTWDHMLTYSCWRHDALTIHPSVNLVRNIGFGAGATHTFIRPTTLKLHSEPMPFPLVHPKYLDPDPKHEALVAVNCGITQQEALRRARASIALASDA